MPNYGVYTGYITCDMAILGLQNAGKNPTRQSFVDGLRKTNGGIYDSRRSHLQPDRPELRALREDQPTGRAACTTCR